MSNLPSGVRYILFIVSPSESDKLHIVRKGLEASDLALRAAGLHGYEHQQTYLYFVTPTRRYTTLTVKRQMQISRDQMPLSVLALTPAKLWKETLDMVYRSAANAVATLAWDSSDKFREVTLRKIKRGDFDTLDAHREYSKGVRKLVHEGLYDGARAANMSERLMLLQRALSAGFYGFVDYEYATSKWPTISTLAVSPHTQYKNLYKASTTSEITNIGIAAVYIGE